MLERPRLKPNLVAQVVPPETVYLLSEREHFALSGGLYALLAPYLDGRHTIDELVDRLENEVAAPEVFYALMQLESRGFLCEAEEGVAPEVAAYWSSLGLDPRTTRSRLEATGVRVAAFGGAPAEPFAAALAALGCQPRADGEFGVVLVDDYLQPELDAYNREALEQGRPWLLVKPVGLVLWLGPLFRPGQTGCWACLAQRLRGNRPVEAFLQRFRGANTPLAVARAALPSSVQAGLGLAASETARAIALSAGQGGPLDGKLVTVDLASLQTQSHWLTRRPQCPRCGQPARNDRPEAAPVVLQSRKKAFTTDGGYRTTPPEETLQRLKRHVSPITGAVSVLESSVAAKDTPLHLYSAGHNWGRPGIDLPGLRQALRSRSGGKGVTDVQARASALCEAIERYAALYRGDEPVVKGTLAQLGPAAVHPNECLLISETQFQQREAFNAAASPFHWLPQPFDPAREVEWTPAWSLTAGTCRYLPAAYCYFGYPLPLDHQFSRSDSNGCAAGNTREEAILQGLLELVERDSVGLWWYNRIRRPRLDLDSFGEPYFRSLADYYRSQGRDIWVLDITSDLGIPSFAALSCRTPERKDVVFGFGAHLDPAIGVLRAVTEMNQMFSYVLAPHAGNGADRGPLDRDLRRWFQTATLENQPYLAPQEGAAPRARADYDRLWTDDLREDVLVCVDVVRRHGLEVLVLDQTQPDIELDVVRVVVPGLRHFWPRFAPGRLYDVPVRMGWLPAPLQEDQFNPIPMFW
jgi:ribosomal protein S12 methylthiotransferase accessory factor